MKLLGCMQQLWEAFCSGLLQGASNPSSQGNEGVCCVLQCILLAILISLPLEHQTRSLTLCSKLSPAGVGIKAPTRSSGEGLLAGTFTQQ